MDTSNFHIGAGALTIDGQDVGATTQDGVLVTYEPTVHEHFSGQFGMTPVKATVIGKRLSLEITLAESTLENMERVFAGSVLSGNKVQFGGNAGLEVVGKVLILTPYDGTEAWRFESAVPTGSVEVAYQVENERVFKVTFTALVSDSAAVAENIAHVS